MTQAQAMKIIREAGQPTLDTSKIEGWTLEALRNALSLMLTDVTEAVNLRRTLRGAEPIRS